MQRSPKSFLALFRHVAPLLATLGSGLPAAAATTPAALQEPPVFASADGMLSVLMIAAKRTGVTLGPVTTNLWTYEVCTLPAPGATACPAGAGQAGLGGVRLALQPGDTLRIRLVNKLPTDTGADHIADNCYLVNNPTNLHTHGLIVEPHRAVGPSDTYGDYVFLEIDNPANTTVLPGCTPGSHVHPGSDLAQGAVNYLDRIEATHPPGLFWFHPHLHGLALNQVSAGLSGVITVGSPADECGDDACRSAVAQSNVRHLMLKDEQVLSGGVLKTQEDPAFCVGAPATPRQGFCPGQNQDPTQPGGPSDYSGGTWVHTVNGQVYPGISVGASGDLWRIVNASATSSYALSLVDAASSQPLPLQIIAIDGVTINAKRGDSLAQIAALLGGKATPVACPGATAAALSQAVCATTIRMMPSARVEVRVLRSDGGTLPSAAIFRTAQYNTGVGDLGDHWPAIDLAAVTLAPRNPAVPAALNLGTAAQAALSSSGELASPSVLQVPGTATLVPAATAGAAVTTPASGPAIQTGLTQATTIAVTPDVAVGNVASLNCNPLAAGHHRKIMFGYPTATTFGLGYVEVDQNGADIEATRTPVKPFDPVHPTVCVPLPGGNAAYEVWELVNLTPEDHNFHIHQTRFYLLAGGTAPGTTIPPVVNGSLVLLDNVPVPRPTSNPAACDGTLGPVQSGACKAISTYLVIPFREIGDFVFHCHILEHEDGGMMARIRVVLAPTVLAGATAQ